MKTNVTRKFPLVKIPVKTETALYLIKEELKSRKFFHVLQQAGLDDCYFQPHLDSLILQSIGLDDGSDETFNRYHNIIEKRSKKIEACHNSIMKQAFKVYHELINEKRKAEVKS